MKLNELYSKPLKEVVEMLELMDVKVHADDGGNVKAVELKYVDTKEKGQREAHNPWT